MRLSDNKESLWRFSAFIITFSSFLFCFTVGWNAQTGEKKSCIRLKNESNSMENAVKDKEAVISSVILHSQNLLLSNGKQHLS